ncbi:MAG TPA: DoxX family protein [Pyrinomonadaceae bacterium]|nr:DoxX family protein [Pyrinomonadaceae bacterium]
MTRTRKIIYWIATVWLALGLFATGVAQLFGADGQGGADMMAKLGYPAYLMALLGVWKILAVAALLAPRFTLIKEWAYAGVVFLTTGAIYSHIAAHDALVEILPSLLLLVLAIISWYLRPATRRISTLPTTT